MNQKEIYKNVELASGPKPETFNDALQLAKLPEPAKNLTVAAYKEFPAERVTEEVIVVGYEKDELFHATAVCLAPDLTDVDDFRQLLANARLYAAAPDLLEAAKAFVELFRISTMHPEDECHEVFHLMSSAVGKALGASS